MDYNSGRPSPENRPEDTKFPSTARERMRRNRVLGEVSSLRPRKHLVCAQDAIFHAESKLDCPNANDRACNHHQGRESDERAESSSPIPSSLRSRRSKHRSEGGKPAWVPFVASCGSTTGARDRHHLQNLKKEEAQASRVVWRRSEGHMAELSLPSSTLALVWKRGAQVHSLGDESALGGSDVVTGATSSWKLVKVTRSFSEQDLFPLAGPTRGSLVASNAVWIGSPHS
ncbi:hypothetical protein GW17_00019759 [Ensete ventricosum]|nr:hypothetical protein GW17_00019759 [Ensete ventricosum]